VATHIAADEARDRGCWRFSSYFQQAKELAHCAVVMARSRDLFLSERSLAGNALGPEKLVQAQP
jgi:hypothetical protein